MRKILIFVFSIYLGLLFVSCDNNSNSKNESELAEKLDIVQVLDSNYTIENILKLNTFQAIENKYGRENMVKDSSIVGPEGTKIEVSVLFPKTPNEVVLYWKQKYIYSKLDAAVIRCDSAGYLGKWHSKLGLQPGQSLEKVIELNQKQFTISGFGWEYGGHIVSWEGGKLDNKGITGRFADFGKNNITDDEKKSIKGDTEFNVNLVAIKKLNPVLAELTVFGSH